MAYGLTNRDHASIRKTATLWGAMHKYLFHGPSRGAECTHPPTATPKVTVVAKSELDRLANLIVVELNYMLMPAPVIGSNTVKRRLVCGR